MPAHIYVVGEVEEPGGPVKIGVTTVRESSSGRAGLSSGNWRQLEVLYREPVPVRGLRWREWLIHRHLDRWHVRGEWFRVRHLQRRLGGWPQLLDAAYAGTVPGCTRWILGNREHHLVEMRRLTVGEPRQFVAVCSCGKRTAWGEGSEPQLRSGRIRYPPPWAGRHERRGTGAAERCPTVTSDRRVLALIRAAWRPSSGPSFGREIGGSGWPRRLRTVSDGHAICHRNRR